MLEITLNNERFDAAGMEDTTPEVSRSKFDPAAMQDDQDYGEEELILQPLSNVSIRRSNATDWFRRHPDVERYRYKACLLEHKSGMETKNILVAPHLADAIDEHIQRVILHYCVTSLDKVFLYPTRRPRQNKRTGLVEQDTNTQNYLKFLELADKTWIKVYWDRDAGEHKHKEGTGLQKQPLFPDIDMFELVKIACASHFISDVDDPIYQYYLNGGGIGE